MKNWPFYLNNLTLDHKESKHEGVRYGCDICNFKTIKESFLTVHKQVQHEGKRINCNACDHKLFMFRFIHDQNYIVVEYKCVQQISDIL